MTFSIKIESILTLKYRESSVLVNLGFRIIIKNKSVPLYIK